MTESDSNSYAIIGGGPSGLAAAKTLSQRGIPVVGFEREDDFGGNWYFDRPASSVCHSTHLISSKRMTEYTDFPMPSSYPPYPNHKQALEYLRSYARNFDLYSRFEFGRTVVRVEPETGSSGWLVTLDDGRPPRRFAGVVIANGHHSTPLWPDIPGKFHGELLHARDYKRPEQFAGRRVLVVGAGNSGCDLAVEAALHARSAAISLRRGYHFLPKFLLGTPIDTGGEWLRRHGAPLWLIRRLTRWMVHIALGPTERYGLPKPTHDLFQTHPIVNSQLLYHVGHGAVQVKADVESFDGSRVRFRDGDSDEFDTVVCATGYRVTFPFLDPGMILDDQGRSRLYLHAFHPRHDDLFVAGMIQPNSGLWALAEWQAKVMAAFIVARRDSPARAEWFRQLKQSSNPDLAHGLRFDNSPRHAIEVEYYSYRERLKKLLRKLEG